MKFKLLVIGLLFSSIGLRAQGLTMGDLLSKEQQDAVNDRNRKLTPENDGAQATVSKQVELSQKYTNHQIEDKRYEETRRRIEGGDKSLGQKKLEAHLNPNGTLDEDRFERKMIEATLAAAKFRVEVERLLQRIDSCEPAALDEAISKLRQRSIELAKETKIELRGGTADANIDTINETFLSLGRGSVEEYKTKNFKKDADFPPYDAKRVNDNRDFWLPYKTKLTEALKAELKK